MLRTFFRSKIHRATVTNTALNYEGSLTIDRALMDAAGIVPYEQIHVLNINNGERFITYAIEGKMDSGIIQVNGSAARLSQKDDIIIILTYCQLENSEIESFKPIVVHVDEKNQILSKLTK